MPETAVNEYGQPCPRGVDVRRAGKARGVGFESVPLAPENRTDGKLGRGAPLANPRHEF